MPARRGRAVPPALLGLLSLLPLPAGAAPVLGVSGAVEATAPRLLVRVTVSNTGDAAAEPLTVEGELLGATDSVRLETGVGKGTRRDLLLAFAGDPPLPGVYPLALHLEHPAAGGTASLRAYLLLALGAHAPPAVSLSAGPASLDTAGPLGVTLASADGRPHRARVRVLLPRGLRTGRPEAEVDLGATGGRRLEFPLLRAGAPRGTRQGVVVLAEVSDGRLHRTSVTTGVVEVLPDPALLPRLRRPLAGLALLLVLAAVAAEWRRWRGSCAA